MGSGELTPWASLLTSLVSLVFVLGLAWLLLRWLKRTSWGRQAINAAAGPRVLRVVGLSTRERLVVVQHHDVELLLGVTASTITVLERRRAEPDAPAARATETTAP